MKTTNDQAKKSSAVATGIIALVLGAGIGVAGTRWYETRTAQGPLATAKPASDQAEAAALLQDPDANLWNPFQEMRQMRSEVDQVFQQSVDRLHNDANLTAFFNENGYASSLDVRDLKDRVEVDAYLPDTKAADAQVNVEGNQLTVEVTHKKTDTTKDKNHETQFEEWGQYDQVVQLPANVQASKMKVVRKDHELIITLPKATETVDSRTG